MKVTESLFLDGGFAATGEVCLDGATIGGNVTCEGGKFTNPDGDALSTDGMRVARSLSLDAGFAPTGTVRLRAASAGTLVDDRACWPTRMILDGFEYRNLISPDRGWRVRSHWLRAQVDYRPEAYAQLVTVYRASGDERAARKILMERHNVLLHPPDHWPSKVSGRLGPLRRRARWVGRQILRFTIGHGYEPWRILGLVIPLVAALSLWFSVARHHDTLVPTDGAAQVTASTCTAHYRCVQPFVLALDSVIPLVEFGQRSAWRPDQSRHSATWYRDGRWLVAGVWIATALGWIFAALVVSSFSQVTKKGLTE